MAKRSQNKIVMITGASAGIAKTMVTKMLREGWTVYGAARRLNQMEDLK